MRKEITLVLTLVILVFTLSRDASATTWADKEVTCPLCETKNTFMTIMSYGSYIYLWPSRFQYIFWPYIDSEVLWSCKKCHLTCFMGDFGKIPQDKLKEIMKQLEGVNLDKEYAKYTDIPMTERLLIAEKVYPVLNKDDEFWCHFYRVKGYHFDKAGKSKEAGEARKKALDLAEKMLAREENKGVRKELLLISGAMRHFLEDYKGALNDFTKALELKYENANLKKEEAENVDEYLTDLLKEYVQIVQKVITKQEIFQLTLEQSWLQEFFHPEKPGRKPLVVVRNEANPSIRLTKFDVPVEYCSKDDIKEKKIEAYFEFTNIDVGEDSATVEFEYPVEKVSGKAVFKKQGDKWELAETSRK